MKNLKGKFPPCRKYSCLQNPNRMYSLQRKLCKPKSLLKMLFPSDILPVLPFRLRRNSLLNILRSCCPIYNILLYRRCNCPPNQSIPYNCCCMKYMLMSRQRMFCHFRKKYSLMHLLMNKSLQGIWYLLLCRRGNTSPQDILSRKFHFYNILDCKMCNIPPFHNIANSLSNRLHRILLPLEKFYRFHRKCKQKQSLLHKCLLYIL